MFGTSIPRSKCAVVIDIGSSSVGISLVVSHELEETLEVIWSHRENSLIKDDTLERKPIKEIQTTLINAFLELAQSGLLILKARNQKEKVLEVLTVVAAPWSYTITKSINLSDDHPFQITHDLLEELVDTAKKQSDTAFAASDIAETLSLKIKHEDIINVRVNGYSINDPINQSGRSISVTHLQTAISSELITALDESIEKIIPNTTHTAVSFMYAYFITLSNLRPNTTEMCLIDVTGETTEVGIVRDGILQQTIYTTMGTFTLARKIAKDCQIPYEEAFSYLKDDMGTLKDKLNSKLYSSIEKILIDYQQNIADLFTRTGDTLSIPKSIFLHTDARTEEFFIEQIKIGAKITTGHTHIVHPFTSKVISSEENGDTALLLAQHFYYHKTDYMRLLPKDI